MEGASVTHDDPFYVELFHDVLSGLMAQGGFDEYDESTLLWLWKEAKRITDGFYKIQMAEIREQWGG
jgi:hypothetical protein